MSERSRGDEPPPPATAERLSAVGGRPATVTGERRPALLSTDCGCEMDDQWALALLARAPEIDLRAVAGAHSPGLSAEGAAATAREVLQAMRATGPPVVAGANAPMPDRRTPVESDASRLLILAAEEFTSERRLAVLVIGPATDVASALLLEPSLAARIEVVAMGFDRWPDGGDPFNVRNDVAAWQALLDADVPLTVGPIDTCVRHLTLIRDDAHAMLAPTGAPGAFLLAILDAFLIREPESARQVTGRPDAWPVWDLIAVAHLLGLTRAESYPRPRLRDDIRFDHSGSPLGEIGWITALDERRLWQRFVVAVAAAGRE